MANRTVFAVVSFDAFVKCIACICAVSRLVSWIQIQSAYTMSWECPKSRQDLWYERKTSYIRMNKKERHLWDIATHAQILSSQKPYIANSQSEKEKLHTKNQRLMVSSQSRAEKEFISDGLKRIMSVLAGNRATQLKNTTFVRWTEDKRWKTWKFHRNFGGKQLLFSKIEPCECLLASNTNECLHLLTSSNFMFISFSILLKG